MAAWLPAVIRSPCWAIEARCYLRGEPRLWQATYSDPIGTTHVPVRRFDSRLEERFFRELRRVAPQWQVLREADPVQIGRHIVCPDFTLVDEQDGRRIPVEIIGYWTPEYLRRKQAILQELPREGRWLLCLDERLLAENGEDFLTTTADIFRFRRRIEVEAFLLFLERWWQRRRIR